MTINGEKIRFFRNDGTPAEGAVYEGGEGPDGELLFFELVGLIRPTLEGNCKYRRLAIRRVFPFVQEPET